MAHTGSVLVASLFLAGALIGAWHTVNALRPVKRGRIGPLWLPALVTGELALHHIVWQALLTGVFVWLGALDRFPGRLALVLTLASWTGLGVLKYRALQARPAVHRALAAGLGADYRDRTDPDLRRATERPVPLLGFLRPVPRLPDGVEWRSGIPYGPHPRQLLDVIARRTTAGRPPVLLQIHGGSWVRGRRDRQARPLMFALAGQGWVCVSAGYRVSPEVTFPDHLVDVKRALAWIRREGPGLGWDTDFVAVTGGSAGGHLAALLALTPGDAEYQPGFEEVDTSVSACIPIYGIFDLLRRDGRTPLWPFLERAVMRVAPGEAPLAWRRAAPQHRIAPAAPPFMVIHGSHDSLVRVGTSRRFVAALRETSRSPVVYAEIPGATHGLEYFSSLRSAAVVEGVSRFLAYVRSTAASGDGAAVGDRP